MERDRHQHAAQEMADRRAEGGRSSRPAWSLHLGHVLVLQVERRTRHRTAAAASWVPAPRTPRSSCGRHPNSPTARARSPGRSAVRLRARAAAASARGSPSDNSRGSTRAERLRSSPAVSSSAPEIRRPIRGRYGARCSRRPRASREFSIMATVSRAASSGRHSTTASTRLIMARFAAASLRCCGGRLTTSTSARVESRSRISSPVVPCSPSMKIVGFAMVAPHASARSAWVVNASAKNWSSGRPHSAAKSRRAASIITGAPHAYT